MSLELTPISIANARRFLRANKVNFRGAIDFAVAVTDGRIRGVIAMRADGRECALTHLYTDGTALVGSLLYGGAWRAAKALGYKAITI